MTGDDPDRETIVIVYQNSVRTLDEWVVSVPTGWDSMNGAARREWCIRHLRRWNSTYKYKYFERR